MPSAGPPLDQHELIVNGRTVRVAVDGDVPLLYMLRNNLDLKGTRFGCGTATHTRRGPRGRGARATRCRGPAPADGCQFRHPFFEPDGGGG